MKVSIKNVIKATSIATTIQMGAALLTKYTVGKYAPDTEYSIGEYTVEVHNNPAIMGLALSAMTGDVDPESKKASVYVDGVFWAAPEDVRECILAHELGHLILEGGMPTNSAYGIIRSLGLCPKEELVADSYAVQLYGKKAVRKMLAHFCKYTALSSGIEMATRFAAVAMH